MLFHQAHQRHCPIDDREFHEFENGLQELIEDRFQIDESESVVVKVFGVSREEVLQKCEGGSRRIFPGKWLFIAAKDWVVIASRKWLIVFR